MMKMRALILLLAIVTASSAQAGDRFRLGSQDKQLHMAASYSLALTGTLLLQKADFSRTNAILLASALTLLAGTAKELVIDKSHSPGDQTANLIGTAASALMVVTFDF